MIRQYAKATFMGQFSPCIWYNVMHRCPVRLIGAQLDYNSIPVTNEWFCIQLQARIYCMS